MAARMRSRMRGELVPRELAPAYERVAAQPRIRELLNELKRINASDSKRRKIGGPTRDLAETVFKEPPLFGYLNDEEMGRFLDYAHKEDAEPGAFENKRLLQEFGRAVYKGLQEQVKAPGKSDPGFEHFKKKFGHWPANIKGGEPNALGCASHAIAVALLADHAGLKTGVIDLPRHVLPVVKLEGKNYLLERSLYGRPNALTIREYLSELAKAHSEPEHLLHRAARASFQEGSPKPADFASKMKYYGGAKAGEALASFNLGLHYAKNREVNEARKHFEASISAFPMPLAHSRLASALQEQGHPVLALKQALAAHSLQPNDENHLLQARGIASKQGWTKRAKQLHDRAYEIIRKKNK